jgi:Tetratricopeptide repeat
MEGGRRAVCASDGTRKRVLGQEHPDTLTSMANLASKYRNQGRWKEAEELEVQVKETRKRVLGQEHPSTLTSGL